MVIQLTGDKGFEIRTKTETILIGPSVKVGAFPLPGPGEYEVADISARGYPGAYLFTAEDMTILAIDNPESVTEETVKQIDEDIDVLLIAVDGDPGRTKRALALVSEIDPKITIPTIASEDHPFCKEVGGCTGPVEEFKIAKKDLNVEERKAVLLHVRPRSRN